MEARGQGEGTGPKRVEKERPDVLLVQSEVGCQGRRARGEVGFTESRLLIMGLRMGMQPGVGSPRFKSCLTNQLCNLGHISTSLSLHFHICNIGIVILTTF